MNETICEYCGIINPSSIGKCLNCGAPLSKGKKINGEITFTDCRFETQEDENILRKTSQRVMIIIGLTILLILVSILIEVVF